jgi:hypothetical protein
MRRQVAAGVLWFLSSLVVVGHLLLIIGRTGGGDDPLAPWSGIGIDVALVLFASVGAFLIRRQAGHRIGWLFLASALFFELSIGGFDYARFFLAHGQTGLGTWAAWLANVDYLPTALIVVYLPLLFPDGQPPGSRWWLVGLAAAAGALLATVGTAITPEVIPLGPSIANPTGIAGARPTGQALVWLGYALLTPGLLGAAASTVVRYRRASDEGRQQIRWFGTAAITLSLGFILSVTGVDPATNRVTPLGTLGEAAAIVGLMALPIAAGIAIVRYRLYQIDVILNRTLVYVPLIAIIGGLYAASVSLFQRLFIAATGQTSDAAIVLSTLILASFFTPIRRSVEGFVDRRFRTPGVLAAAGTAPEANVDSDAVTTELMRLSARVQALERRVQAGETTSASKHH